MANNRDDRTKIDFTVADRVMLAEINRKLDELNGIKVEVTRNTTWIRAIKWIFPSVIVLMVASRLLGF